MSTTRRITAYIIDATEGNKDLVIDVHDNDGSLMWGCQGSFGSIPSGRPSGDDDVVLAVATALSLDVLSVYVDSSRAKESVSRAVNLFGMSLDEVASESSVSESVVRGLFSGVATKLPLVDAVRINRGLAFVYRKSNSVSTGGVVSLIPSCESQKAVLSMMYRAMSTEDISEMSGVSGKMIDSIVNGRRAVVPASTHAKLIATEERTRGTRFHPASSWSRSEAYRKARQLIGSAASSL